MNYKKELLLGGKNSLDKNMLDKRSILLNVLSLFFPFIGFILFASLKKDMPKKSKSIAIFSIIGIIIYLMFASLLIVVAIFGKDMLKEYDVVVFDNGSVKAYEYEVYYRMFYPLLSTYELDEEKIPKMIANKAADDKILLELAKNEGIKLSSSDKEKVDQKLKDENYSMSLKKLGIDMKVLKQIYENDCIINTYTNMITQNAPENTENISTYLSEFIYKKSDEKHVEILEENLNKILTTIKSNKK